MNIEKIESQFVFQYNNVHIDEAKSSQSWQGAQLEQFLFYNFGIKALPVLAFNKSATVDMV